MRLAAPPSRRIRCLRLHAPAENHARRATTLMEDALRTASLPGADSGRLVLIRRLDLGRVDARDGAMTFALRLERAARDAVLVSVPGESPAAGVASAVTFRDRTEALTLLARRLAWRLSATEWFWSSAVPGWRANQTRSKQWLALLTLAHALPAAAFAAAAVLREVAAGGAVAEVVGSLPAGIGAQWLRAVGFDPELQVVDGITTSLTETHLVREPALLEILETCAVEKDLADDRVLWFATMLAVADNPRRAADPTLPARVHSWLTARAGQMRRLPVRREIAASSSADEFSRDESLPPTRTASQPLPDAPESAVSESSQLPFLEAETLPVESEPTAFGGLLFLVPVLQRLGFPEWLASQPALLEAGFGFALLEAIGQRVGMEGNDPLLRALRSDQAQRQNPEARGRCSLSPAEGERVGVRGQPCPGSGSSTDPSPWPSPLPKGRGNLLRARVVNSGGSSVAPGFQAAGTTPEVQNRPEEFAPWIKAARSWCRRQARIGLHSLIVRPARVTATATHLDLHFALDAADLPVRRAALDLDPGWVPWLGRVIHFHYDDDFAP